MKKLSCKLLATKKITWKNIKKLFFHRIFSGLSWFWLAIVTLLLGTWYNIINTNQLYSCFNCSWVAILIVTISCRCSNYIYIYCSALKKKSLNWKIQGDNFIYLRKCRVNLTFISFVTLVQFIINIHYINYIHIYWLEIATFIFERRFEKRYTFWTFLCA